MCFVFKDVLLILQTFRPAKKTSESKQQIVILVNKAGVAVKSLQPQSQFLPVLRFP